MDDNEWWLIFTEWQRTITDRHRLTRIIPDRKRPTKDDAWSSRTNRRMIPDRHGPTEDDAWSSRTGEHHRSLLLCVVCSATLHILYTPTRLFTYEWWSYTVYNMAVSIFDGALCCWTKKRNAPSTREVSVFLTRVRVQTLPQNQRKSLDWKISIFVRGAFFFILYWPGRRLEDNRKIKV